ncbi:MAG: DeoR/GlpR family DNA-binding transcription regulator [Chloroflexi bacterium]|nr:DeoR/GlpR family DNA-binding transcription regulator [Chloroflexota bacterium]
MGATVPESNLIPAERHAHILALARQRRAVKVSALSEAFGVSEVTIRRDLENLEEQGLLERTHGGAVLAERMQREPLYVKKDRLYPEIKSAIGKAAAQLVNEGETIFVHSGSTTRQVLAHLPHVTGLRVITSNAAAIAELTDRGDSIELIVLGGTYRWQSNSLVGSFALATVAQINAKKTFLGVDGISVLHGLTTPIQEEAEIARAMIERTFGSIIVVADHTKMGVVAEFTTCPLAKVNTVVTDAGLDAEWRESLKEQGISIIEVSPE